jgi:hypothetical protein
MNQQALEALACQRRAELRDQAAHVQQPHRFWHALPHQSLREWTGWTLVDLGLKLVARRGQSAAPRPVGS